MLNGKDDLGLGRVSKPQRIAAAAVLAVCGLATFTMRGYAQPPAAELHTSGSGDEPVVRIARASLPKSSEDPTDGLFQRSGVSSGEVANCQNAAFAIRLSEIFDHQALAPYVSLANATCADSMKTQFGLPTTPSVDLRSIEVIYGNAEVTIGQAKETGLSEVKFGFGAPGTQVRFIKQFDAVQWVKQNIAGVVERESNGTSFLEIPSIPAIGPLPVLVAKRTPGEFCVASVPRGGAKDDDLSLSKRTHEFVENVNRLPQRNVSAWAKPLDDVNGGLFTIAFTSDGVQVPEELEIDDKMHADEIEARRVFHRVEQSFQAAAFGLDMDAGDRKLGFRVCVSAADDARLEVLLADIRQLVAVLEDLCEKSFDGTNVENEDSPQLEFESGLSQQFFDRMLIEKASDPAGSPYVTIRTSIEHPSLIRLVQTLLASVL